MIKRRTVLGLMGAAAGMATIGQTASAARAARGSRSLDLEDKRQLALAFRRLAYSLDNSVTFWWMRGTRYGVVDSVATPFWDMYVGAWFTTRDLSEDSYEVTMASANFYTPVNSGELLTSFRNPYTEEVVPVTYIEPKPWRTVFSPEGGSAFGGGESSGMKTTRSDAPGPGWIEGEDVVIRGDMVMNSVPVDPASGLKPFHVNDWSTYVGKLADVANPKVKSAPAVQYFTDILSWPKWLRMGDLPGSFVSRCYGRKVFAYEQMPATWRRLFEQAMPEKAKNAADLVKGN
ncbi:MAG TPA: DUF1838 family protein [Steroidobacter sp.]|uniref:DUF1838 family protein n=1 Tax=Steroidobacter sp. TaxID=1978227 RepID=UPI002ED81F6F